MPKIAQMLKERASEAGYPKAELYQQAAKEIEDQEQRLNAYKKLIQDLTYQGVSRRYTRGSALWKSEVREAAERCGLNEVQIRLLTGITN